MLFLVSSYVGEVRAQVEPLEAVLSLREDVPALTPVSDDMVTEVTMPRRWVPDSAIRDRVAVVGLVASSDLTGGSILQEGMLIPPPEVRPGEREIAILVDAETGVAGKIGAGSVVDIYATFPEVAAADGAVQPPRSQIVVSGARILDVGVPGAAEAPEEADADQFGGGEVVPVTFALSVRESLILTYVESFATKLRLGLRGEGDEQPVSGDERTFQPSAGADFLQSPTPSPTPAAGGGG